MDSWRSPENRARGIAHSVVNGLGVCALTVLHLWGSLDAQWAAGGILALCGLWIGATRKGPPSSPPGGAGAISNITDLVSRRRK